MGAKTIVQRGIGMARIGVLVIGVLLLAACGSEADPVAQPSGALPTRTLPPPTETAIPPTAPTTPTPTELPGPAALRSTTAPAAAPPAPAQAIVELALADLVSAQGIAPAEVRLVSLEAFTWTDNAWNCAARAADDAPESAEVPGYRVVFATGTGAVVYHTDSQGALFVCEDAAWLAQTGEPVLLDPIAEAMVAASQEDAARRLTLEIAAIRPVSVLTLTWPDASLGCPKPGVDYDTRETPGYRIVLQAANAQAIYHASARETVRCTLEEEILPGLLRQALAAEIISEP
jgi:hypothetical protein